MENELVLDQVGKTFDDGSLVLRNIDLRLAQGTKLSVLGPSGSGKTTLLRLIAGLETPDSGNIFFVGQRINDLPPHQRRFGMMFQEFALFPHMNVFDNIGYGLRMKGFSRERIQVRVKEMLALTGLSGFEKRQVDALSGGERQRVALARALAPEPRLLMLDEPLSSLDRVLRKRLLAELTAILSRLNITTLFVTHDHEEAFAAGSRVIIMNQGSIEQAGRPDELVQSPKNQWVRGFLGL
jgi:ABC-type Fe3+/spermidine/putrescine transport system ATPase subunit